MHRPAREATPLGLERALTTGLLCGPGGALGHVAAGGTAPSATVLLLVTAVALAGALGVVVLGRGRLGTPVMLGLAGGAQLVFHQMFGAAPAHGHEMGGAGHDPVAMALTHAGVAVLVAGVARGAEASWWALARAVVVRLLPRLPEPHPAGPVVGPRAGRVAPRPVVVGAQVVTEVVGPRGPPAGPTPARVTA